MSSDGTDSGLSSAAAGTVLVPPADLARMGYEPLLLRSVAEEDEERAADC